MKQQDEIKIEDLYPELTPEEQQEAEENLLEYLEAVIRIADKLRRDPARYREFCELTGFPYDPRMVTTEHIIDFNHQGA